MTKGPRSGRNPPALPGRIVLVGLPGSGKTTTGRALARRLRRPFVDLDEEVERAAGCTVAEIFAREGESGFRRREAEATRAVPPDEPLVVAAGGGWMARPELRDAWPDAVRVWLRVEPREAAARLGGGAAARPLLAGGETVRRLTELLGRRRADYAVAEIHVAAGRRTPERLAAAIERRLTAGRTRDAGTLGEGRRPAER